MATIESIQKRLADVVVLPPQLPHDEVQAMPVEQQLICLAEKRTGFSNMSLDARRVLMLISRLHKNPHDQNPLAGMKAHDQVTFALEKLELAQ